MKSPREAKKITLDQLAPSLIGKSVTDGRTGPLAGCPPCQALGKRSVRGRMTQHCGTSLLFIGGGRPGRLPLQTPFSRHLSTAPPGGFLMALDRARTVPATHQLAELPAAAGAAVGVNPSPCSLRDEKTSRALKASGEALWRCRLRQV